MVLRISLTKWLSYPDMHLRANCLASMAMFFSCFLFHFICFFSRSLLQFSSLLGCLCGPVINSVSGRRCRKTVSRGREDTRVWYRETMFSQMVSYDFRLHEPLYGYFLYLVSAPPPWKTHKALRTWRRLLAFDHRSHSIIFLLCEFKSVRWYSAKCSRCIQTDTPFTVGSHQKKWL